MTFMTLICTSIQLFNKYRLPHLPIYVPQFNNKCAYFLDYNINNAKATVCYFFTDKPLK